MHHKNQVHSLIFYVQTWQTSHKNLVFQFNFPNFENAILWTGNETRRELYAISVSFSASLFSLPQNMQIKGGGECQLVLIVHLKAEQCFSVDPKSSNQHGWHLEKRRTDTACNLEIWLKWPEKPIRQSSVAYVMGMVTSMLMGTWMLCICTIKVSNVRGGVADNAASGMMVGQTASWMDQPMLPEKKSC